MKVVWHHFPLWNLPWQCPFQLLTLLSFQELMRLRCTMLPLLPMLFYASCMVCVHLYATCVYWIKNDRSAVIISGKFSVKKDKFARKHRH